MRPLAILVALAGSAMVPIYLGHPTAANTTLTGYTEFDASDGSITKITCPEQANISMLFRSRVVRHWQRLPRDVVDAPCLETFKMRLDWALSNLI